MSTPTEIKLSWAYTCLHHNDKQRVECPVCLVTALTAERDQLRAELADQAARFHDEIVSRQGTVRANQELDLKELNQLRDQLAAEREKVTMLLSDAYALTKNWHDRAERAEAELAKYLSACPASPTEEERKRCQQWWAISGKSP